MTRRLVAASALLAGCAFGGSDDNPLLGSSQGGARAAAPATEAPSDQVDAATPSTPSAGTPADAGATAGPRASDAGGSPRSLSPKGTCGPATDPAVCDPVRNTGCPPIPLMQCDVEPSAAQPTGRCAIFTPTPIVACSATTTAQSVACFAKSSCVDGECRPLCYCDTDCPTGMTCSGDLTGGFRICR